MTWSGWIYTNCNKLWAVASAASRALLPAQPGLDACASLPRGPAVAAGMGPPQHGHIPGPSPGPGRAQKTWSVCTWSRQSPGPGPSSRLPSAPCRPHRLLPSLHPWTQHHSLLHKLEGGAGLLPVRPVLISPRAAVNHGIPGLRKLLKEVIPGLHPILPSRPWGWAQDLGFLTSTW
uniref:Uncharacterized protein n=1 Tax=Myotis myotis TaxID=51298 RepID=A0A7J7T6K8_MYOMY|nr:hypothetical protein mMyoMyo1_009177 [Myotis myotis]